jgi:hypothetical protein
MKLYAFKSNTHGPLSWFVMAESVDHAIEYVKKEIDYLTKINKMNPYDYNYGIENYKIIELSKGEVIANSND